MKTFEPLQQLMQKKMTRKEFLEHLLAIFVAMIGIKSLIQLLVNPSNKKSQSHIKSAKAKAGYGGSTPYGV